MDEKKKKKIWAAFDKGSRLLLLGVIGAAAAAIAMAYFGIWSYGKYREELIETEKKQLLIMAETVGTSLVNFVEQELDNIDLYFSSVDGQDHLTGERIARQAAEAFLEEKDGLYTAMSCFDSEGDLLYKQGRIDGAELLEGAGDHAAIRGKRFLEDHYEMYVSRRLRQPQGDYTVIFAMNLEWLYSRIVQPVRIGNGGYSIVKDRELSIIMHHAKSQLGMDAYCDRSLRYPQLDLSDLGRWIERQKTEEKGTSVIHSYRWDDPKLTPEKRIVAYTTISLPGEEWIVNSTLPFEELSVPLNHMLWRLMGMCLMFAVMAAVFVYLLTRSLMKTASQKKEISYLRRINEDAELLRKKDEELSHFQRIQSIGQMSSHIAHEFNNYLTPVMLYGGMLQEDDSIGEENKQLVDGILSAASQAAELSRKLLDFSRQDTGRQYQILDLSKETREAVNMIRPLTPEHIRLETELTEEPLLVRCRRGMIQQILMNLSSNAYHAMEKKTGTLTLRLERRENREGRREACLSVTDTGCGIQAENLTKIFDPYYTTKRSGQGTGLGLSVIQNLMRAAGGEIHVESELGRGTAFYLYFPLAEEPADGLRRQAVKNGTILVVDDDKQVRRGIAQYLKKKHCRVECFESAPQAILWLENTKNQASLLLTDYDMPLMNGLELAQRVRTLRPKLFVVLMSGGRADSLVGAKERGVIDVFVLKSDLEKYLNSVL